LGNQRCDGSGREACQRFARLVDRRHSGQSAQEAAVVREKRITTPDGHVWYVRRRWAKRQLPWKRRANYELSPAERDAVPIVADTDELLGPVVEFFSLDAELGLLIVLAFLALVALGVFALVGVVREWVAPFLVANIGWIGATLAAIGVLVLLDRKHWPHPPVELVTIAGRPAASRRTLSSPGRPGGV
jgi:hypothetical protein